MTHVADTALMRRSPRDCGVLLLRAWSETGAPAEVRVRVLVADPGLQGASAYSVGVDPVCDLIRQWLLSLATGEEITETPR